MVIVCWNGPVDMPATLWGYPFENRHAAVLDFTQLSLVPSRSLSYSQ